MGMNGFADAEEDSRIFFLDLEGMNFQGYKNYINNMFYEKIKEGFEDEYQKRIFLDFSGVYMDRNPIVLGEHVPGTMMAQYKDCPSYLIRANEDLGLDELSDLVLDSAEEMKKDLVVGSISKYVSGMRLMLPGKVITEEQIEDATEKIHAAYKEVYDMLHE